MAHISELALFDYVAGKGDLTVEELEHLGECADCNALVIEFRRVLDRGEEAA